MRELAHDLAVLEDLAGDPEEGGDAHEVRVERAARTRLSLGEMELLLKEVHHRVTNNLQIVSSLLSLQARTIADPAIRDKFNESQSRVRSIALVHEQLYRSGSLTHVDGTDYLTTLIESLLCTHDAARRGITHRVDANHIKLPLDLAIPCGLIVNELVTNSLKHGFRDERAGTISVRLTEPEPGLLDLVVADDGSGLRHDVDLEKTGSLGLELVYTFAAQIDAKVDRRGPPGLEFRFRFRSRI